jgi:NAD(P)-dependent dehydrogenase (short-subunit alcohol dehydrogenase family)
MKSLINTTVAVIGGSSGMGLAVAHLAKAQGATVFIGSRTAERVAAASAELGVTGYTVDSTDEASVAAFFAKVGSLDHLVVTGSAVKTGSLSELSLADAEFTFRSKFFGPYLCAKHAKLASTGSITFFSGILSRRPGKNDAILGGVNAAVEAMGRALARDLAPIRVNTLSPGMTRDTSAYLKMPEEAREGMFSFIASKLPVGKVGQPEDIAAAVLMLMTNPFITGVTLDVDGGGVLV